MKRIEYIDIAKGIAMVSIVLGHLGSSTIDRLVFTFHVPIFYLISGYFFGIKDSDGDFLKKKINNLIIPYFFTCLLMCLISVPININRGLNWKNELLKWIYASFYAAGGDSLEPFLHKGIGALWFLWAIFWGNLFLKMLLHFQSKIRVFLVSLIFCVSIYSATIFWLPLNIQAGGCCICQPKIRSTAH